MDDSAFLWIWFISFIVVLLVLYGLYQLWLRIRPELLTPPKYWPNKAAYIRANKQFENIMFWPTKLGFTGDIWIINLWLATFILIPAMIPIALPIWLFNGLPNHWFWYRIRQRRKRRR